jgi:hypothetical protein
MCNKNLFTSIFRVLQVKFRRVRKKSHSPGAQRPGTLGNKRDFESLAAAKDLMESPHGKPSWKALMESPWT